MNIKNTLQGEKTLAKLALNIAPTIENAFKGFEGKKCKLVGGDKSKEFKTLCSNYIDSLGIEGRNPFVYVSTCNHWVRIEMKTHVEFEAVRGQRNYASFNGVFYIGKIDADNIFHYDFDTGDNSHYDGYKNMLKTTEKQVLAAQKKVQALKEKEKGILSKLPREFHDTIKKGY